MKSTLISSIAAYLWAGVFLLAAPLKAGAAQWDLIAQSNQGFYYLDLRTVEQDGDRKTAWSVLDYREEQSLRDGSRYRSTHAQVQFNCKARLARLVHLTHYSGPMLGGAVVQRQGMLQDWFEIDPRSPMHRLAYRVC